MTADSPPAWKPEWDDLLRLTPRYRLLFGRDPLRWGPELDRMLARIAGVPARPEEPTLPPLPRQAANLAGAVGRTVVRAATGRAVLASPETLEARLATCAACPKWLAESRRCSLCGCRTDAKLRLAAESCPDAPPRWGPAHGGAVADPEERKPLR